MGFIANRLRGRKAKKNGKIFENHVFNCAKAQGFAVFHVEDGCQRLSKERTVPVKQMCDLVIGKHGKAVFFDAKTVETGNFTFSDIKTNQVEPLSEFEAMGFVSGYVIEFKQYNKTSFFSAGHLLRMKPRESLKPEQGLIIGEGNDVNLDLLVQA